MSYQCRLLIILANSLDPDQALGFVGPDLRVILKIFRKEFFQKVHFEKKSADE